MMSLTTAQRDLLHHMLATEAPLSVSLLGQQLHLTPRQVQYSLREIRAWLDQRHVTVRQTPGVGVQLVCSPEEKRRLLADLTSKAKFQLVLSSDERQQLLLLQLLAAHEPFILSQFQQTLAVARATVLKDLDAIEPWLDGFQLTLVRRQHRGFWVDGAEFAKRQALAALLWGDIPFERPLMAVVHGQGILFALARDAGLLPVVGQVNALVQGWDLPAGQDAVAWAERALGGRFTDEAAMQLALTIALQLQRARAEQHPQWDAPALRWVQTQAAWSVAAQLAEQLWPALPHTARTAETAALALQLIAGARDEPWRNDLGADELFRGLIQTLLEHIARAYGVPELANDGLLRDGLEANLLPPCVRQRFGLWAPPRPATDTHTERYAAERAVASQLAADVAAIAGMALPPDAYDELILLLRAAVVRARPEGARRVLVVCPSGMATTQLLVARLKARFPRLGAFEVLPLRELTAARVADAALIISTVPLTLPGELAVDVIQVHPMLNPDDVVALSQWMA